MLKINLTRLQRRLETLARIGAIPGGGVCRLTLTDEDRMARDLLKIWFAELQLELHVDEIGNMFGVLAGEQENRYVGIGSHLDTVPTGGRYDGALGVAAAIEVAQVVRESGVRLRKSLVVCNFTNEEGARFTPDMMGSLAHREPNQVSSYKKAISTDQKILGDELTRIGYAGSIKCGSFSFDNFLELHIEQGPILESSGDDIGIVTGVQGIYWQRITIHGKSAHAGTTPLEHRRDAFYALSRLSSYARELCHSIPGQLITIGSIQVEPNAINVVPEKVVATLDYRNPDGDGLKNAVQQVKEFVDTDPGFSNLKTAVEELVNIPPVEFDGLSKKTIEQVCKEFGYRSKFLHSGAGHDAQILAFKYPSAMIFIPSVGGISHAVDEYSTPEQIEKGCNVMLNTAIKLLAF